MDNLRGRVEKVQRMLALSCAFKGSPKCKSYFPLPSDSGHQTVPPDLVILFIKGTLRASHCKCEGSLSNRMGHCQICEVF